jgi:hypothetical protein
MSRNIITFNHLPHSVARPVTEKDTATKTRQRNRPGTSRISLGDQHRPGAAIHRHALAGGDAFGGAGHTNNGGDPVLACDNGPVRHHAAHLHHQAAGGEKQWRPARIG